MRTNLPVTQKERDYPADATLMSCTDTQSRIAYANEAFIQVSGFEASELLGQPHNLVRHPDMPPEAFGDMWATLKAGESWTALVKNRCKNGDHYWVRANATPVVRQGKVTGYMSVRTRPARQEVQHAEALYQRFRTGTAGSLRFHKGMVVHGGWQAWRSVFQLMSLRWRLALGPLLILGLSLAAGALAGLTLGQWLVLLVGDLVAAAAGMVWLNAQIAQPLEQIHKQAAAVASGQPGENLALYRSDTIGMILRAVNQSGLNLRSLVDDVSSQVHGLRDAAQDIAQGNQELHGRTDATAAQLQQTAASMTQMTSTVRANTQTALDANSYAGEASGAARHGGEVVGQVVHTMRDITDSSRKIADIIGVIDGIAFQTNILAQRSAEAAKEIKGLIQASVERVEAGSELVNNAGQAMEAIVAKVSEVSHLIEQISHASKDQAAGIDQVNAAVTHLDDVTQQNAALVQQSTEAAGSLQQRTGRLADAIGVFKMA